MGADVVAGEPLPEDAAGIVASLLARLERLAVPANVAGMARYGISPVGTLGVSMPSIRGLERELRPLRRSSPQIAHEVAARLWASGCHEARILAGLVDVPALVTPHQADAWVADLDSWDTCDQLQGLFVPTPFAYAKASEWAGAEATFVKRAGFVLMCALAVHDKAADDERLIAFLPLVVREATDDRNFVKKAVNWALRQIGKRSAACHAAALSAGEEILARHPGSTAARWVARDALRELRSEPVLARLTPQAVS
jgi:3-methyladenine DNA glycosylase AlkD